MEIQRIKEKNSLHTFKDSIVYRCYIDGIVCYNLTFCTEKSLMTDLG